MGVLSLRRSPGHLVLASLILLAAFDLTLGNGDCLKCDDGDDGCFVCRNKKDGDYRACQSECEKGFFYSCVAGLTYEMPCPPGRYKDRQGNDVSARTVYDSATGTCQMESDDCPRENLKVPTSDGSGGSGGSAGSGGGGSKTCIGHGGSCQGKDNGDYPKCPPDCDEGHFITCSNGEMTETRCADAWYTDGSNNRFPAPMMFDAASGRCAEATTSCSRTASRTFQVGQGSGQQSSGQSGQGSGQQSSGQSGQSRGQQSSGQSGQSSSSSSSSKCDRSNLDVLFVVDSSGSVGFFNFKVLAWFLATFSQNFVISPQHTHFGALLYSTHVYRVFDFDDYSSNAMVYNALRSMPFIGGTTNTGFALLAARVYGFSAWFGHRYHAEKVAIVVTDGISNNAFHTKLEADKLKSSGVTVIVIGIGLYVRQSELEAIATSPDHIFNVRTFNQLLWILEDLTRLTCEAGKQEPCVTDSCVGFADGNYRECGSKCQEGFYFSCSGEFGNRMPCALGPYHDKNGNLFHAQMVYDAKSDSCELEVDSCPRDPDKYNAVTSSGTGSGYVVRACIPANRGSCVGKPDGNYAMCYPDCQKGSYIACVSGEAKTMPCAEANYNDKYGKSYKRRMVFNRQTGRCVKNDQVECPRENFPDRTPGRSPSYGPAVKCPDGTKGDVLFIMDSSGSVGPWNWYTMKSFAAGIAHYFTVGPNDFQFSAIRYASSPSIMFKLNQYSNFYSVFWSLLFMPYTGGSTNTATALRLARQTALAPAYGARNGVAKIVIVLTDGMSNNPQDTAAQASRLKAQTGVTVLAVGIGHYANLLLPELRAIASTNNHVFTASSFYMLLGLRNQVIDSICKAASSINVCIKDSCYGQPNGDYASCEGCEEGTFITCSNGYLYKMTCASDWYVIPGYRLVAPMVFDPTIKKCVKYMPSCPRDEADYASGKYPVPT